MPERDAAASGAATDVGDTTFRGEGDETGTAALRASLVALDALEARASGVTPAPTDVAVLAVVAATAFFGCCGLGVRSPGEVR